MRLKKLASLLMALMLAITATICPAHAWTLSVNDWNTYFYALAAKHGTEPYQMLDITDKLFVCVNGAIVDFPDTQPYVDENDRTLMPVRFVTEQLGADVSWNGATSTATIKKNGISVDVTIGSKTLKVTKDGKTATVDMDTAAVNKDGRTMVPIRFVAEALDSYVEYVSSFAGSPTKATKYEQAGIMCRAVMIYNDALTPKEIVRLRDYPYTYDGSMLSLYHDGKFHDQTIRRVDEYYKTSLPLMIDLPYSKANAAVIMEGVYDEMLNTRVGDCTRLIANINDQLNRAYQGPYKLSFRGDLSCAYDASYRGKSPNNTTIRGYLTIERNPTQEGPEMYHDLQVALQRGAIWTEYLARVQRGEPFMKCVNTLSDLIDESGGKITRPVDVQASPWPDANGTYHIDSIVDLTDTDLLERPGTEWPVFSRSTGDFIRLGYPETADECALYRGDSE